MKNKSIPIRLNYIFLRFGIPPTDDEGNYMCSSQYIYGEKACKEDGISVFEGVKRYKKFYVILSGSKMRSSWDELTHQNRDLYWVDGETMNSEGADGEILLNPNTFRVIKKINKEDVGDWDEYVYNNKLLEEVIRIKTIMESN